MGELLKMMKAILFLACAALASARNIKVDQLEYGFCDGSAEPASIDFATVEPFPVVLATGETITIGVQITLNEVVPEGAQVSLKIKKEGLLDIPFPCLEIEGLHIGSCDYDGQHLLELGAEALCPTYFPDGQDCSLPLNPGVNTNNIHTNHIHTNHIHTNNIHTDNLHTNNIHTNNIYTNNLHTNHIHTNNVHTNNIHTNIHSNHIHTYNIHTNNIHTDNIHTNIHTNNIHTNNIHTNNIH